MSKTSGRFQAVELGSFEPRSAFNQDAKALAPDGSPVAFRKKRWGRGFTAEGEDGRVIGEYKRAGFSTRGTIVWDGVEYEWGKTSAWTSAYRLSRLSEELATFDPKSLGNRIAIDLSAGNLPKELVLFCAWMAHVAAAASG